MQTIHNPLTDLSRPKIMIGAVRFGLSGYARDTVLRRILGTTQPAPGPRLVTALTEIEAEFEDRRRSGAPDYDIARHVEALIALVAETRTMLQGARAAEPELTLVS